MERSKWEGVVEARLDSILEKLGAIEYTLNGNGKEGLKVIVDRNTQSIAFLKKLFWTAVAATLTALATMLFI